MSVGPLGGVAGSVAGSPLAQTKGSEPERAQQDTVAQQRRVESDQKAESAAGIGETDGEDHATAERDADGRRPWEPPPEAKDKDAKDKDAKDKDAKDKDKDAEQTGPTPPRQGKDATGQSGNLLDLSG